MQDDASFTQHIKDFVAQLASEHDTVGTTRSFNTTSGRTVSVYGSAYGWKIDQDAEAAQLTEEIRTGTQTTREPVYSMRANSYGYNDIGSTYIEVDLSSQHMYYYQNGSIIFDSDIVSGDIRYDDRAMYKQANYYIVRFLCQNLTILLNLIQITILRLANSTSFSFDHCLCPVPCMGRFEF